MHLPRKSPPLRGLWLRVVSRLVQVDLFRNLLLRRVRRDARIRELPEAR